MQHSYSVLRNRTILIYDCALQQSYVLCLCYIYPTAVPIPIVIISAASRNDHYLIRHAHDEDSPHYNKIKA